METYVRLICVVLSTFTIDLFLDTLSTIAHFLIELPPLSITTLHSKKCFAMESQEEFRTALDLCLNCSCSALAQFHELLSTLFAEVVSQSDSYFAEIASFTSNIDGSSNLYVLNHLRAYVDFLHDTLDGIIIWMETSSASSNESWINILKSSSGMNGATIFSGLKQLFCSSFLALSNVENSLRSCRSDSLLQLMNTLLKSIRQICDIFGQCLMFSTGDDEFTSNEDPLSASHGYIFQIVSCSTSFLNWVYEVASHKDTGFKASLKEKCSSQETFTLAAFRDTLFETCVLAESPSKVMQRIQSIVKEFFVNYADDSESGSDEFSRISFSISEIFSCLFEKHLSVLAAYETRTIFIYLGSSKSEVSTGLAVSSLLYGLLFLPCTSSSIEIIQSLSSFFSECCFLAKEDVDSAKALFHKAFLKQIIPNDTTGSIDVFSAFSVFTVLAMSLPSTDYSDDSFKELGCLETANLELMRCLWRFAMFHLYQQPIFSTVLQHCIFQRHAMPVFLNMTSLCKAFVDDPHNIENNLREMSLSQQHAMCLLQCLSTLLDDTAEVLSLDDEDNSVEKSFEGNFVLLLVSFDFVPNIAAFER